jgi:hypothetical protein
MTDDDNMYQRLSSAVRVRLVESTTTGERQPPTMAIALSKKWGIRLQIAANTIKVAMQMGIRYSVNPLHCRWRTQKSHL